MEQSAPILRVEGVSKRYGGVRALENASLFREKGFAAVGVAEAMRAAGMTHGGFYNHFGSKEALEAAACDAIFDRLVTLIAAIAEIADKSERREAFEAYRRRYLSKKARDASAPNCPMVAFAGDMTRQSEAVRLAYGKGLAAYLDGFTRASGAERAEALRRFAMLAGALTLARSIAASDPELSDEILESALR